MSDSVLSIFIIVFILLGAYNVYTGLKRQREAQLRGQRIPWYKQISLLTGIEYLLLSFVFMLSINNRHKTLPGFIQAIIVPLYLLVLLSSAVIAGMVIRQSILNARLNRRGTPVAARNNSVAQVSNEAENTELDADKRAASIQQRRERRQKAAAARRRRSGRA